MTGPNPPREIAETPGDRSLWHELQQVINRHSRENASGTPDFILAAYLLDALTSYEATVKARDAWYRWTPTIGGTVPAVDSPVNPADLRQQ